MKAKAGSPDSYEVLGLSALVSKLFLDEHPLFDQVNRARRHKLILRISDPDSAYTRMVLSTKPTFYSVQDGLDPETARPGKAIVEVNRDKFFATMVLFAADKPYSVREAVLFVANVMGGVHAGSPNSDKDRVLAAINARYVLGGLPASVRQLKSIARVLLRAMEPLRASILSAA